MLIHPDDRRWTVMDFDNSFYINYCLPMGLKTATDIWGRLADLLQLSSEYALAKAFRRMGSDLHLMQNWVDDFVVIASLGALLQADAMLLVYIHGLARTMLKLNKGIDQMSIGVLLCIEPQRRLVRWTSESQGTSLNRRKFRDPNFDRTVVSEQGCKECWHVGAAFL